MHKILRAALASVIAFLIVANAVYAATYSASITIVESGAVSYTKLPLFYSLTTSNLTGNGFMEADALDSRVLTTASVELPHLFASDRLLFVTDLGANTTVNNTLTLGNTDLTFMPVITGYGGYITTADAAALEPGNEFEIEVSGYIDTSAGADKNILFKDDALRLYVSGAGTLTGTMSNAGSISPFSDTGDGFVYVYFPGSTYNQIRNATGGSGGTASSAATLIEMGQLQDGASEYTIGRAFLYFDTSAIPDDATITAASINIYGSQASAVAFDITVMNGQPTYPSSPLVNTDYQNTKYSGDGGTLAAATLSTVGYNALNLNATGISWISLTGTTKLALFSSRDIAGTSPINGNNEWIRFYSSDEAGTGKDPYLSVTYTQTSTVSGAVASGTHTIKLTADGATLKLYDGAAELDSDTVITAEDNANNFVWVDNNVMPYANYLKYSVGGTLIAHYQPITIISGTTMPDREGAAQNGTITWGTNPADIAITLGALVSESQPAPGLPPSGGDPVDVLPPITQPGWASQSEVALQSNPFYPIVDAMSTLSGFSDMQVWIFFASGIVIFGMILVFKFMPHILAVSVSGGVLSGFFVAIGIYPFWVVFIFILATLGILFKEITSQGAI